MKKIFLFATALVALASCTESEFVGDNSPTTTQENGTEGAINFGSGFKAVTRADKVGADAADLLGAKFYVAGVKGDGTGSGQTPVFQTYSVEWTVNTAGKTESNTSDWEYVGKTHDFSASTSVTSQTIKFWDYATTAYDFCAYSLGKSPSATGTAITYANAGTGAYTLTGAAADLEKCYITDMVTVTKKSGNYGKEVELSFRSLATKVRMALYETVPGYSVRNVRFYQDDATVISEDLSADDPYANATLFGNDVFYTNGTYTVTFPHIGSGNDRHPDYNKAHVSFEPTASTNADTQSFGTLNYTSSKLATTSSVPTFAGAAAPYYVTMLPNETGAVLEMRVNYELVADDGASEVITVHGAKAFVPAAYTMWKPNYAYTYIFKISDNTNGWTSTTTTDPAGLYPITFDAVVLDPIATTSEQTTITSVAMPSITTYQKGHVYSASNEYTATSSTSDSIYVQVFCGDPNDATAPIALREDLNTKGKLYTVTAGVSEAEVMDALNIQASDVSGTITGRNGKVLTPVVAADYKVSDGSTNFSRIPAVDGTFTPVAAYTTLRFKAASGTSYAFVYDATPSSAPTAKYIYSAENFAKGSLEPTGWGTLYWDNPDGTGSAITSPWDSSAFDATNGQTYYRRWINLNKVYGVKVIKVQ